MGPYPAPVIHAQNRNCCIKGAETLKTNPKVHAVIAGLEAIDRGFEDILGWAGSCRFADCAHTSEKGCAVREAVAAGRLEQERLNSYLKQRDEAAYVAKQPNKTKAMDYMKQWKMFARE